MHKECTQNMPGGKATYRKLRELGQGGSAQNPTDTALKGQAEQEASTEEKGTTPAL